MINVIDQDKCIGCGTCFKSCSLDVFRLDTDQSKVSPCMAACPAGTDIRGYNALVQQGKLEEAAQKLRQANPFPGITGRICFHPCEKECARNAVDGAVNINAVEQFLGDLDLPEAPPSGIRPRSPWWVRPRRAFLRLFIPHGLPRHRFRGRAAPRRYAPLRHPGLPPARRRGRGACGPA
ncbi:MAG: 4Fe-4S binding protein [Bilophila wadsworthia]